MLLKSFQKVFSHNRSELGPRFKKHRRVIWLWCDSVIFLRRIHGWNGFRRVKFIGNCKPTIDYLLSITTADLDEIHLLSLPEQTSKRISFAYWCAMRLFWHVSCVLFKDSSVVLNINGALDPKWNLSRCHRWNLCLDNHLSCRCRIISN